jgi:putative SOS response-associated peptidase YedK
VSAFREAFARRRCIEHADGYFEWTGSGAARQPIWFHRPDGRLIYFAGLYESWRPQPEQWQPTFTIITAAPNDLLSRVPASPRRRCCIVVWSGI